MGPARIYPLKRMHRSRAPSIAPGTFFVAQSWADSITDMPGFNLRQAQEVRSIILPANPQPGAEAPGNTTVRPVTLLPLHVAGVYSSSRPQQLGGQEQTCALAEAHPSFWGNYAAGKVN
jgi:hypothetical protein